MSDLERRLKKAEERLAAGDAEADPLVTEAQEAFAAICAEFSLDPRDAPPASQPADRRAWFLERLAYGDAQRVQHDDDEPPTATIADGQPTGDNR